MNSIPRLGYEYQVGGSLPINAPTYVRRQADEDFYSCLKNGEFCYVLNSRQMGKSSLRVQTMQRLEDDGFACAALDITAIGTADITPVEWYAGVIDYLVESFNLYTDFELKAWWQENSLLSPVQHFSKFIETILLERVEQNIIIFIDEIDSILSLTFNSDDFFAVIRDCYNRRASIGAYNRLTFALLGVSTPSDLIQDRRRTPFNIGRAIDLTGFQLSEAFPLAQGLAALGDPTELMQAVLSWTCGQPFLTQKVCRLLLLEAGVNREKPSILVEKLVQKRIIDNWEAQDEPEHLKTIRDRILLGFEKRKGRLLGLCQQILTSNGQGIVADNSPEQTQLRLTGLVVRRDGMLKIYNRIYKSVFNLSCIEQELAKLRPYADAIDAWTASNFKDESRLLRGQALQDALLWASDKGLSDEDNRFLLASQEFANREVAIALNAERRAKEILAEAQAKAELALEVEKQANQRLTEAQRLATSKLNKAQYDLTATRLERDGINILCQFQTGDEIASLLLAMQAGRQLKSLVKDKQSLADYPAYSPVFSLQEILLNIRERNQLQGHQDQVYRVAFSPNGKTLASASRDKTIKLWSVTTGKQIASLTGHKDPVISVAFSPDGKTLASASYDNTIKLWYVPTRKQIASLTGHTDRVYSVAWSPDGKTLASASYDNTIKLWDVTTNKQISSLTGHTDVIYRVAFSLDGATLASASQDNNIKLWNVSTRKEIASLTGHQNGVISVAFSPDSKTLASASLDKTIKLWNVITGKEIASLTGHQFPVNCAAFSPDGKTLASASSENTIKLWNIATGKEIASLTGHKDVVWSVAFSPGGKTLASASSDRTIKLWNVTTCKQIAFLTGHKDVVWSVAWSSDGKTLASASRDKTIKLWNVATNKQIASLTGHTESVISVAFCSDGKTLASASGDKTIKLWNIATGEEIASLTGHTESVISVAFCSDSKTLASASWDNTIKLWNIATGEEIASLTGHTESVNSVAFSADGKTLASASGDQTIKLWNVVTRKQIASLTDQSRALNVAWSPDSKTLASASRDNTIKLWNVATRKQIASLIGHQSMVWSVAWSPDGKTLASASNDNTIKLWNVATGEQIASLTGHTGRVNSVAWSPDGKTLASASWDNTIKFWNLDLDDLLNQGCRYLESYFASHPDAKKGLCP